MDKVTRLPARATTAPRTTPGTAAGTTPARRRAIEHPGRFAIVAVGLMLVASLVAVAIGSADTRDARQVPGVEAQSVSPKPNTLVPPQEPISIDLPDDLTGRLVIVTPTGRRVTIPDDQVHITPGIQVLKFQPGPGEEIERYDPGVNTVIVYYQRLGDTTYKDIGSYSWSFRSTS